MYNLLTVRRLLGCIFEFIPVAIPAIVASFSVAAVIFLLMGYFHALLVAILGVVISVVVVVCIWGRYNFAKHDNDTLRTVCNVLVLVGVVVWGIFNVFYSSQRLIVEGDAGVYSNTAVLLMDGDTVVTEAPVSISYDDDLDGESIGFGAGKSALGSEGLYMYAWGSSLLSALASLAGEIVGIEGALAANVLFGMSALMAIYATARVFANPWWSLVVTAVMAVSMPMIYFSREMYSEPLTLTFVFGAIALASVAYQSKSKLLWLISGLVAGSSAMTRIDAFLTVAALVFAAAVIMLVARKVDFASVCKQVACFVCGLLVTSGLGVLILLLLSKPYYLGHEKLILQELALIAASLVVGVGATIVAYKTNLRVWLNTHTIGWRAQASVLAAGFFILLLISRPLYYKVLPGGDEYNLLVAGTTNWVAWYLGGSILALGFIGILMSLYRAMSRRDFVLIILLAVVLSTAALYLVIPKISLVQVYAARRFLPVILPGFAIFAAITLTWISSSVFKRLNNRFFTVSASILIACVLIIPPLVTTKPLLLNRTATQLGIVERMCAAIPSDSIVLWLAPARNNMVYTTKSVCNVESIAYGPIVPRNVGDGGGLLPMPSIAELADMSADAERDGKQLIVAAFGEDEHHLPDYISSGVSMVSHGEYQELLFTPDHPPTDFSLAVRSIVMSVVSADGSVRPL